MAQKYSTSDKTRCVHYHVTGKMAGRRCSLPAEGGSYCHTHGYADPCKGCGEVPPETIKVSVIIQITINVPEYQAAYGRDDIATIKHDVKYAVLNAVTSGGVLADGIADADLR